MKKALSYIFATILLITAVYINFYYWTVSEVDELRNLPPLLLTAVIIYLLIQLIKKSLNKNKVVWYDWVYYLGIVGILLPLISIFSSGEWLFTVTKIGAIFLLIPPIIAVIMLRNKSKNKDKNEHEETTRDHKEST